MIAVSIPRQESPAPSWPVAIQKLCESVSNMRGRAIVRINDHYLTCAGRDGLNAIERSRATVFNTAGEAFVYAYQFAFNQDVQVEVLDPTEVVEYRDDWGLHRRVA